MAPCSPRFRERVIDGERFWSAAILAQVRQFYFQAARWRTFQWWSRATSRSKVGGLAPPLHLAALPQHRRSRQFARQSLPVAQRPDHVAGQVTHPPRRAQHAVRQHHVARSQQQPLPQHQLADVQGGGIRYMESHGRLRGWLAGAKPSYSGPPSSFIPLTWRVCRRAALQNSPPRACWQVVVPGS
jgi:hypothetical protein